MTRADELMLGEDRMSGEFPTPRQIRLFPCRKTIAHIFNLSRMGALTVTFGQRLRICEVARSVVQGNLGEAKRNRIAAVV